MAGWAEWLATAACGAGGCTQISMNLAGQAAYIPAYVTKAAAQPAMPAGDCRVALIGTWTWGGVNRLLERQGMAAVEMETRMELRADGSFVQRQRSRAEGEEWAEAESRGTWSVAQASGSSDPRHCTLTMQGNRVAVMLTDRESLDLPGLGITYRRAPD